MLITKDGVNGSSSSAAFLVDEEERSLILLKRAAAVGVDEENIGDGPAGTPDAREEVTLGRIKRLYASVSRAAMILAFWARYSGLYIVCLPLNVSPDSADWIS